MGVAKNLVTYAIRGDISRFQDLLEQTSNWDEFKYCIDIQLRLHNKQTKNNNTASIEEPDGMESNVPCQKYNITLNLFHIVIILCQSKPLKAILCKIDKLDDSMEYLKEPVKVNANVACTGEDSWILQATCLHLAAKFNPEGLHFLLSHMKMDCKIKSMEYVHKKGSFSPLHLAAAKVDDSRSTRYVTRGGCYQVCLDLDEATTAVRGSW